MRFKLPEIPPPQLLATLRGYNLLPAIIFLPTRRRCDESAMEVSLRKQNPNPEKFEARRKIFDEYILENPEIKSHKHKNILLRAGVASHHAGHIPAWKLLVEKMMSAGLLDAIFATSTVAAGVDFPARSVVLSFADTRGNNGWRPLQASELQQMTGRAGRRGKDNVGFVILAPSNFQNPPRIAKLLHSPPDALESRFRATYSSLLNLLDAYKSFAQVREIAEKSFAFRETAHQIVRLENKVNKRFESLDKQIQLSGIENLTVENLRGFERLVSVRNRMQENPSITRTAVRQKWLEENVQAGRVVSQGRSGSRFFLILDVYGEKVSAMRDDGSGAKFAISRINRVYAKKYPLSGNSIEQAFDEIHEGKNPPLDEPRMSEIKGETDDALQIINQAIEKITPENLSDDTKRAEQQFLWETMPDAEFIEFTRRDIEILRAGVWQPFENRAKVLNHFGYLDFNQQTVTESGKWLADLRVDRPLLIGEALRHGIFERLEPKHVAGLMAALAADSERNYGEIYLSDKILETLGEFEEIVFEVSGIEWKFGVEPAPEMNFSAAAAAESWANGMDWSELVFQTKAEEGDLVRLLSRTGEALLQISNLKESNPKAAEIARTTAEIILREPIR
jgi:ATP-dependent RNA helicase HelY